MSSKHFGETLNQHEADQVRALAQKLGETDATARLGVSAATFARAVARLHIQRGTAALIRQRLAELAEAA